MTKLTQSHLANLQNEATAVDTINANSDAVVSAFDNTLSRDGTSPNQMMSSLDMNNNQIINVPAPTNPNSLVRLGDVASIAGGSFTVNTLPTGGSTNAILHKNSNTNYDATWTLAPQGLTTLGATQVLTSNAFIGIDATFLGSSGTTAVKASSTASGTLTLPAATDTLVGKATTDILTNKTIDTAGAGNVLKINGTGISAVTGTGSAVLATSPTVTTPNIVGTTSGSSASAGSVGEVITLTTTGTSIATGVPVNAVTITLTPGDWDVTGSAFWPAANTWTGMIYSIASISVVTGALNMTPGNCVSTQSGGTTPTQAVALTIPTLRFNVTGSSLPIFLTTQSAFSTAGGSTVSGYLFARRVR